MHWQPGEESLAVFSGHEFGRKMSLGVRFVVFCISLDLWCIRVLILATVFTFWLAGEGRFKVRVRVGVRVRVRLIGLGLWLGLG